MTDRHVLMERIGAVFTGGPEHTGGPDSELFKASPLPMWVYDVETLDILEVNRAAEQRYGYTRSEFLSLTLRELRPAEDVPKFLELTTELPHFDRSGPWRHRTKDGTVIQVLINSHSIRYGPRKARLVIAEDPDQAPL